MGLYLEEKFRNSKVIIRIEWKACKSLGMQDSDI